MSDAELQRHFGPGLAGWITAFGLHDLYHTGWFRLLLILLCVNLTVCSLDRLPKTMKLLSRREEALSAKKIEKFSLRASIPSKHAPEEARSRIAKVLEASGFPGQLVEGDHGLGVIAEKGRWAPYMVYVVHLSVLVVLFGALLGSILGFKGFMNITEGEASDTVATAMGHDQVVLPFSVRCDDFDVTFYDQGTPKEFRSDLVILENGKEAHKQTIRVNVPLTYRGITFYQSSYGSTLKETELEFQDKMNGKSETLVLPFRQIRLIPGTQDRVQVVEYEQDFNRFGPAIGVVLQKDGQKESSGSWILVNKPDFHGNRIMNYGIRVVRAEPSQFTGLQVKRDPGVWWVYAGFTAMLIGIGLAYYTSHRRLWALALPEGNGSKVLLAGRASKNSLAFEEEFNGLCERLKAGLQ
jgi:cytochrome c biogenesis protein